MNWEQSTELRAGRKRDEAKDKEQRTLARDRGMRKMCLGNRLGREVAMERYSGKEGDGRLTTITAEVVKTNLKKKKGVLGRKR